MIPSQMRKGILDSCILQVIQRKETYGYDISLELQKFGFTDISEGTIYPLLLRLEKLELIQATYRLSSLGPRRKYFTITEKGRADIKEFQLHWEELKKIVDELMGGL